MIERDSAGYNSLELFPGPRLGSSVPDMIRGIVEKENVELNRYASVEPKGKLVAVADLEKLKSVLF